MFLADKRRLISFKMETDCGSLAWTMVSWSGWCCGLPEPGSMFGGMCRMWRAYIWSGQGFSAGNGADMRAMRALLAELAEVGAAGEADASSRG